MKTTQTQKEVEDFFYANEYVSPSTIETFKEKLSKESGRKGLKTLSTALKDFANEQCPNCGVAGSYKWHFLGKLHHPDCGFFWYVRHKTYVKHWIKATLKAGVEMGGATRGGCLDALYNLFLTIVIGIPLVIVIVPIRVIVSIKQGRPITK